MRAFLSELQRRKVVRAAVLYGAVAFVLLQAADLVVPALLLPPWTLTFILVLLLFGFPVALVLAWVVEPRPAATVSGERAPPNPEQTGEAAVRTPGLRRRPVVYAGIVVAILAVSGLFALPRLLNRSTRDEVPEIRSLAVLPLDDYAADPEQEYFADGMTEALISELSRLGAVKVISRTSVMQYKGTRSKPLPDIARELNLDALVEGSVLRADGRVRITAQLIHGPTDYHLWSDSYERDLANVLALQGEVARAIAQEIRARLAPEERTRLAREQRPVDPAAYDAYLKARFEMSRLTAAAMRRAIEHFQETIRLDPRYAPAHAGLSLAYILFSQPLGGGDNRKYLPLARAAAERALELDPQLAEAHANLGGVHFIYDRDWEAAEREYRRAVERDPLSLDTRTIVCEGFVHAREFERAMAECRNILELDPDFGRARAYLRRGYEGLGRFEGAIEVYAEGRLRADTSAAARGDIDALRRAFATRGAQGYWEWVLERSGGVGTNASHALAALGRVDELLALLERWYEERSGNLCFLRDSPYDPVRDDPRFRAFLARLRLD
ncbi:MAG: hypothetical protein HY701_14150 [Gemmatimonadetes bacterium]|nr:hypothetical protein [Gemmatimonadota bacterium]